MTPKFRFVTATRETEQDFLEKTALGRTISLVRAPGAELMLFTRNKTGLPKIYNEALRRASSDPAVMIFIHDDVHLCDLFWPHHITNGLRVFDVIGLAGNVRRVPRQPAWPLIDDSFTWDDFQNLSGVIGHGKGFPPEDVSHYGPPERAVALLDGVFLAAHSETLNSRGIAFDERFEFHFYDMDFCRQAEAKGLRLGTWPISVVHESAGVGGTAEWHAGYQKYLEKWEG